jgi:hypothetical protein
LIGNEPTLAHHRSRAVRRLARLFRIERNGGFDRRPPGLIARLIERRGILVDELMVNLQRRSIANTSSAELDRTLNALAREVDRTLDHARARLEEISKDLRVSRGEGLPTGIRNRAHGQALGKI